MWLFTKYGFFSIVKKQFKEDDPPFQIRSRESGDLKNPCRLCELEKEIIHTPHADYHYRITVDQLDLNKIMNCLEDSIDYDNFKSMIHIDQIKSKNWMLIIGFGRQCMIYSNRKTLD